ncbi:MAG: DUF3006 domain-containing protein [Firmicutes bacterium]|nr:DUF3006 domain-containing protein [Dethiobacter sp.]MBS3889005.1 DUF3006 domain-containing protein [Bacillota bacterium]MBS4054036.1 DUF3006 domain-containing protein [Thermaerobacter sp.]
MKMIAVVDRIESLQAVLLLGEEEVRVCLPLTCLPPISEGSVLDIAITLNKSQEEQRRCEATMLMQKLKRPRTET